MSYTRRVPENTSLYKAVKKYFPRFVQRVQLEGKSLPSFVHKTFRKYLKCGRLIYGSIRLYCYTCRRTKLVSFSCKCRGLCPSCSARRMTEASILQSETMIPHVPMRQWVLTFPHPLTLFLAYRPDVLTEVLELFVKVVRYFYRQKCLIYNVPPIDHDDPSYLDLYSDLYPNDIGAVTCIQRFTDALSLYPHFHTLFTDGLFAVRDYIIEPENKFESAQFIPLPQLTDEDLIDVLIYFKHRVTKRFVRRGYLRPTDHGDDSFELYWGSDVLSEEEQSLLRCYAASSRLKYAFGERTGQSLQFEYSELATHHAKIKSPLCVEWGGFGLHAARSLRADDREQLTQLCRYIQRPPLAQNRLQMLDDGRFYYAFKRIWSNGAKGIMFNGEDLIERLAALIPMPRKNLTRYHGVFAPRSRFKHVVNARSKRDHDRFVRVQRHKRRVYYTMWAELMRKVFVHDVLGCQFCNGRMAVVASIQTVQIDVLECLIKYDGGARDPP